MKVYIVIEKDDSGYDYTVTTNLLVTLDKVEAEAEVFLKSKKKEKNEDCTYLIGTHTIKSIKNES